MSGLAIPGIGGRVAEAMAGGKVIRFAITVDGLANLILDMQKQGHQPISIALSERDRRDLNDDLMSASIAPISKADGADNQMHIAMIKGVQVGWSRHVKNGQCVVNLKPPAQ